MRKPFAILLMRLARRMEDLSLRLYSRRERLADRFRNRPRPYLSAADIPMIDDEDD